jgi:hypothetical protein
MKFVRIFALLALVTATGQAVQAAIVSLDIQVNEAAKTYNVFASIDDPASDGLASFIIDVLGLGGVSITSGNMVAPSTFTSPTVFTGFTQFASNGASSGTNWLGITATQDTFTPGSANTRTVRNYGVGTPVLLASGTYAGTAGSLTAQLSIDTTPPISVFTFNLLPDGWTGGQATVAATSVTSDSFSLTAVPEPSTLAAAGVVIVGGLLVRRRQSSRQLEAIQA